MVRRLWMWVRALARRDLVERERQDLTATGIYHYRSISSRSIV